MDSSSTILVGGIIASEVLFWVLLFGGLAAGTCCAHRG